MNVQFYGMNTTSRFYNIELISAFIHHYIFFFFESISTYITSFPFYQNHYVILRRALHVYTY